MRIRREPVAERMTVITEKDPTLADRPTPEAPAPSVPVTKAAYEKPLVSDLVGATQPAGSDPLRPSEVAEAAWRVGPFYILRLNPGTVRITDDDPGAAKTIVTDSGQFRLRARDGRELHITISASSEPETHEREKEPTGSEETDGTT